MSAKLEPYTEEVSRRKPSAIIFLLDQSASMEEQFANYSISKAEGAANAINLTLYEIVTRATKGTEVYNWVDISIIGYGSEENLASHVSKTPFQTLTELANTPLSFKTFPKGKDEFGVFHESEYKMPIWFAPIHNSNTPMYAALKLAKDDLADWIKNHPDNRPPLVINITDGEATDGDPEPVANEIMQLATSNGNVLVWNCHITKHQVNPIAFPGTENFSTLTGTDLELAKKMFRMSSRIPQPYLKAGSALNISFAEGARGLVFNSNPVSMLKMIDMGSRKNLTSDVR